MRGQSPARNDNPCLRYCSARRVNRTEISLQHTEVVPANHNELPELSSLQEGDLVIVCFIYTGKQHLHLHIREYPSPKSFALGLADVHNAAFWQHGRERLLAGSCKMLLHSPGPQLCTALEDTETTQCKGTYTGSLLPGLFLGKRKITESDIQSQKERKWRCKELEKKNIKYLK